MTLDTLISARGNHRGRRRRNSVIKTDTGYHGVAAVVDKDFAAEKLAELVHADYLFILTAVDRVAVNFGKPDQQDILRMTPDEADAYIAQNQFAPGEHAAQVQAACEFAKSREGRKAIIGSLEKRRWPSRGKAVR